MVEVTTGDNCLIGIIKTDATNAAAPNVDCKDIAIDHTDGRLYCLANGVDLRTIDRVALFGVGGGAPLNVLNPLAVNIDSNFVGNLVDITGGGGFNNANSLEIDSQGRAYLSGAGNQAGKLYNLNLGPVGGGQATLRIDFDPSPGNGVEEYVSSGDLAKDESSGNHLYITLLCENLPVGEECVGPDGMAGTADDDVNDSLYRILLNTPGCVGPCPDTLVPLAELNKGGVFAMDIAQVSLNLCYVNIEGFLFETDRNGNEIKSMMLGPNLVAAFGASGNDIGGTLLMINTMALLIAAGQSNPMWLILLAISGVAVVSYQFKDKIKSINKKINE